MAWRPAWARGPRGLVGAPADVGQGLRHHAAAPISMRSWKDSIPGRGLEVWTGVDAPQPSLSRGPYEGQDGCLDFADEETEQVPGTGALTPVLGNGAALGDLDRTGQPAGHTWGRESWSRTSWV